MILADLLRGERVKESALPMETEITKVCTDSREAEAGCLFLCIDGVKVDGHTFID